MIKLHNKDCIELMATMVDASLDIICIDPPYLYLKNQKLERRFDEQLFFAECKRLLTKDGFIVMFGRGESFYRWNTRLADLGFVFKEEIVWDKKFVSNAINALSRFHETISIHSCSANINTSYVPYEEIRDINISSVSADLRRIKSALNNPIELEALTKYINTKEIEYTRDSTRGFNATIQGVKKDPSRAVTTLRSICEGMKEQSIIRIGRDHYNTIHPTQKPVRLLERLLALVLPKNKERKDVVVADFFGGSFSTMEACHNMGLQGVACEIDEEYFNLGKERIENLKEIPPKQQLLF